MKFCIKKVLNKFHIRNKCQFSNVQTFWIIISPNRKKIFLALRHLYILEKFLFLMKRSVKYVGLTKMEESRALTLKNDCSFCKIGYSFVTMWRTHLSQKERSPFCSNERWQLQTTCRILFVVLLFFKHYCYVLKQKYLNWKLFRVILFMQCFLHVLFWINGIQNACHLNLICYHRRNMKFFEPASSFKAFRSICCKSQKISKKLCYENYQL